MKKISASFLGCKKISNVLKKLNVTDVDYIHVDIMDGKYVRNKTMPIDELLEISYYTRKRLDIHLMVMKPLKLIDSLATLNAEYITVHLNIKDKIDAIIEKCHLFGIKVGIAINPNQSISDVYPYLDQIDLVLIMGVEPGKSGQEFIPDTFKKLKEIKNEIVNRGLKTLISIDGGVNFFNAKDLKQTDILVSGSTITNSDDYQLAITQLRKSLL